MLEARGRQALRRPSDGIPGVPDPEFHALTSGSRWSILKARVLAFEMQLIEDALRAALGNRTAAARALGIKTDTLNMKLHRHREHYPDPNWDDAPLAWAVRYDGDRTAPTPCWTRAEIEAEAIGASTVAFVLDEGDARRLAREMNTMIAVRAAEIARQQGLDVLGV
jgi:hypothetical protein